MDCSARFHSKMSKVENLLSIIDDEVDSATKLLNYLKEHSFEMVEALRKISSSTTFLKEFLEINSFLLKYLDFLTEINCKFEMLQNFKKERSTEDSFGNSKPPAGVRLKPCKSESDVNFNDNSIISTFLPGNNKLDCFTDVDKNNATKTSCVDINSLGSKCKKAQNQILVLADKKNENLPIKKLLSANSYFKDKEIGCDAVQIYSSEPLAKEMFGEVIIHGRGSILSTYCIKESEEDCFKDSVNECHPLVNNPGNKHLSKEIETKTMLVTEKNSVTEISCTAINDIESNAEVESVKYSNSTLTNDNSLSLVSALQLERCNDKLYEIRPVNISRKVGEEYKVVVERIISPSEFYVYILQSHLHSFAELEEKLKLIQKDPNFHKKKESKEHLSQVIGKYALYYSKCEEIWCRVKVTDWRLNQKDDLVYVFLLDYGESKCVVLSDLQPMPDCFKLYPAFVQRCHLFGIHPTEVNLSSKILTWSKQAIEKVKCLVDTSENIKIKISPEDTYHPAKSLPVTLWLVDQNDSCVNDLLVRSQYAQLARKPVTVSDSISENEKLEKWNPMKEDFDSYLNSYDLDVEDPAAAIYGYIGRDYDRICKHFAKTGRCFKGESCKKEHVPLNPLGFTTDKEEVYKNAVNPLPLPPPESVISVQVTCILSLNTFCCIRDESAWTCEEETLQSLVQYMNSKENIRDMKKLLIPPSVGQLVIAKYSQDSSWYRGKIIESQPESDQYSILFVDYGNKETMPLSCIRGMEGRYLHLPFQAMQCCIFGIRQNPKVSAKECMDYLNERISDEHVNIEVVATFPGDHPRLLVHVLDQNGKNVAKDLIDKGHAIFKQELLFNSNSNSIPG